MKQALENPLKKYSQHNSLIFLLRHGQIEGSDKKRYIGQTDVPLDDTGILQANYWRDQFSSIKMDTVYSSSLKRCAGSAELIAKNQKIIVTPKINEINMGTWDGKTFDQIKTEQSVEFEKRGKSIDTFRPPNGESFFDVHCRVNSYFDKYINNREERILIITHAGVIRIILCHILEMELKDLFKIKVFYGELFVILRNKSSF